MQWRVLWRDPVKVLWSEKWRLKWEFLTSFFSPWPASINKSGIFSESMDKFSKSALNIHVHQLLTRYTQVNWLITQIRRTLFYLRLSAVCWVSCISSLSIRPVYFGSGPAVECNCDICRKRAWVRWKFAPASRRPPWTRPGRSSDASARPLERPCSDDARA